MNKTPSKPVERTVDSDHMRSPRGPTRHAPPVIHEWTEVEIPYCYGYAARKQFAGPHPEWKPWKQWNEGLEIKLKNERAAIQTLTRGDPYTNRDAGLPLIGLACEARSQGGSRYRRTSKA